MAEHNPLAKITSIAEVREMVTVDLGRFNKSYRGATFDVWVTPTAAHTDKWAEVQTWLQERSKAGKEVLTKLDEQHAERIARLQEEGRAADAIAIEAEYQTERTLLNERLTAEMEEEFNERLLHYVADTCLNWEVEDLRQARDHLLATNPLAWDWLTKQVFETIGEYKRKQLKN